MDDIGLNTEDIQKIRTELASCERPLIFFHDDADGLASFLLIYRYLNKGKGVVVKSNPSLDEKYLRKVEETQPDMIIVLDLAVVSQEFIDSANVPIIWIDHHGPYERTGVQYFNPRLRGSEFNAPASYLCYQVVERDMWIAMTGIVGDWFLTPLAEPFREQYPDLLPISVITPPDALFTTEIGKLAQVFNFVLKGTSSDAMKYAKVLSRIEDPYEILKKTSTKGTYLYKKYEKLNKDYHLLLSKAAEHPQEGRILLYTYPASKTSFTGELSNELLFKFPDKIIIIARENSGMMKCSLRSKDITISQPLSRALVGIDGYGGGHEHACGCCIKMTDFPRFIENLNREIDEEEKKT